jgi:hypothetical protein
MRMKKKVAYNFKVAKWIVISIILVQINLSTRLTIYFN